MADMHVAYIYVASCIVQAHTVALAGHQQLKVTQSFVAVACVQLTDLAHPSKIGERKCSLQISEGQVASSRMTCHEGSLVTTLQGSIV